MLETESIRIGSRIQIPRNSPAYLQMTSHLPGKEAREKEVCTVEVIGFILQGNKTPIRVQYEDGHIELRSDLTIENTVLLTY